MKPNIGYLLAKRSDLHLHKEAFVDVEQCKRQTYRQYNLNTKPGCACIEKKGEIR
jgi:hypothetical protein